MRNTIARRSPMRLRRTGGGVGPRAGLCPSVSAVSNALPRAVSVFRPGDGRVLVLVRVGREAPNELVDRLDRDLLVQHVVDEDRRRGAAGSEALELDEGKSAVGGGFPHFG